MKKALDDLSFIKYNIDGKIKGYARASGKKKIQHNTKSEISSPKFNYYSMILMHVVDTYEGWYGSSPTRAHI